MYGDTQTQGAVMVRHQRIVWDGLGISVVRGYSDTGGGDEWTSKDDLGILGHSNPDLLGMPLMPSPIFRTCFAWTSLDCRRIWQLGV